MEPFRADLHCHSLASDGSDDPLDLVRLAKKSNLQGLSITDHDTTAAYTLKLFELAQELSIRILSGIEISTEIEGESVHVLGYGYDLSSPLLAEFLKQMRIRRKERSRLILEKLAERKMPLDVSDLPQEVIGRPHIAWLLVRKGYVRSLQEAFDLYLKDGACCWVSGFRATPLDAIEQIHLAKGKAILAHPHIYKKKALLKKVLSLPFDGIECYYSLLPKALELPWLNVARERGWIATGGSDYHGSARPNVRLGASWVGKAVFEALCLQKN